MANGASPEAQAGLWALLGIAGTLIFAGRFYLQWLVSERQKRSVIPIGFWYMSATGALILLVYSAIITSPVGALSYCFNLVIYSRNLVHIWRERGRLTPRLNHTVHGAVAIIVIASTTLAAYVWLQEYHQTKDLARK